MPAWRHHGVVRRGSSRSLECASWRSARWAAQVFGCGDCHGFDASDTPDHTTLSRRSSRVEVPGVAKAHDGPIHLGIDSTGLKRVGDGEWHAHKHRTSNKRRRWRKLHLAVDGHGFIVASRLNESPSDDAATGVVLLGGLRTTIDRFTADGAYDSRALYEAVSAIGSPALKIVIPPKSTAVVDFRAQGAWRQRNEALERIEQVGRRQWRKESGADGQARAENGMYRYKSIIGDRLRARTAGAQKTEALIAVNVLNRMTELGTPESVAIRA